MEWVAVNTSVSLPNHNNLIPYFFLIFIIQDNKYTSLRGHLTFLEAEKERRGGALKLKEEKSEKKATKQTEKRNK